MISEKAETKITEAVNTECNYCLNKHGKFHNHHEAWAVLREEVQEVIECFAPFDRVTDSQMDLLWDGIRHEELDEAEERIGKINDIALELVKEGIQVLAMCKKWMMLIETERKA